MNYKKLVILFISIALLSIGLIIIPPILKRAFPAEPEPPKICEPPIELTKDKCRDLAMIQALKSNQILTIQLAAKTLNELTQQENELTMTIKQLESKKPVEKK